MKVVVLGASGFLGVNMVEATLRRADCEVTAISRNIVEFPFSRASLSVMGCNLDEIADRILITRPELVVNCIAMANPGICEEQPEQALLINGLFPEQLARTCSEVGCQLVHLSTDAVFGSNDRVFTENDVPKPVNVYGRTKLEGDRRVLEINPDALVARINPFGWSVRRPGRRGQFVERVLDTLESGEQPVGFTDVTFATMYVQHLCDLLLALGASRTNGVLNVVGTEVLTKYDFLVALAKEFGYPSDQVLPGRISDVSHLANRSSSALDNSRLRSTIGTGIPTVSEGLAAMHRDIDIFTAQLEPGRH